MTAVSEVAQTDTTGIQEWVKESLKRTKKKKSLSPPTLSLIEEKNRKKDAAVLIAVLSLMFLPR